MKTINGVNLMCDLNQFYSYIREYQFADLTGVTYIKSDTIILDFDGRSLEIGVLDDLSYIKLKKVVSTVAIENKFKIISEDVYGNIK